MNRRMRDNMMDRNMRDERNPYGSRGGYVVSSRRDNSYDRRYDNRDYDYMDDYNYDREYRDGRRGGRSDRRYDGSMSFEGEYRGDFRSGDYGSGYLSNKELRHWQEKLCKSMDQQECEMLMFDDVIHCAKEMNISFDKYTEEEFYTTVLMMYTDYKNTCGNNIHMFVSMAKDFLEDRDAGVRYGEKLAVYYDAIACA